LEEKDRFPILQTIEAQDGNLNSFPCLRVSVVFSFISVFRILLIIG
jgi:hypothetical protein